MGTHYNAFISYKHAELDNKVAAMIEKDLEHYHIPARLKKKTGYKKIERIFRDKDELPITSDLSDSINEALLNSDYLIVLCSKSTHLSTWVEREIEFFLKSHPQDRVLTVIAEGEPSEVIPKVLLQREINTTNEKGEAETVTTSVEPLSCDYRLSRREVKNTEVPRLVAALIGCGYNELMDRHRQYKTRRFTAIAAGIMALSVGFGAYMFQSNQKINENYRQSLISQSMFLSAEAEEMLDDEQRVTALQLALAALPGDENPDRPVIPEAERAITKATYAYVPKYGSNIAATWNYTMTDMILEYCVDLDGDSIAAFDKNKVVNVWNANTHEVVLTYDRRENEEADHISYVAKNTLVISASSALTAYDTNTGEVLWENKADLKSLDSWGWGKKPIVYNDEYFYMPVYLSGLYKISVKDGTVVDKLMIPSDKENQYYTFDDGVLSPSKEKIAFLSSNGVINAISDNVKEEVKLVVADLNSKEYEEIDLVGEGFYGEGDIIEEIYWADEDTICLSANTSGLYQNSNYGSYSAGALTVLTENNIKILCLDYKEHSARWENLFSYILPASKGMFSGTIGENGVAYAYGNRADVWDLDTGELLNTYTTDAPIISIEPYKNELSVYTSDGKSMYSSVEKGKSYIAGNKYFTEDIEDMKFMRSVDEPGILVHTYGSSELLLYQLHIYDKEVTPFDGAKKHEFGKNFSNEDYVISLSQEDDHMILSLYDAQSKKLLMDKEIEGSSTSRFVSADVHNGKAYLFIDDEGLFYYEIDLTTFEVSEKITVLENGTGLDRNYYAFDAEEGVVTWFYQDVHFYHFGFFNLETGEKTEDDIEIDEYIYPHVIEYEPELGIIYVGGTYDFIYHMKDKSIQPVTLPGDYEETHHISVDKEHDRIITCDDRCLCIMDLDGNEIYSIKSPDAAKPFEPNILDKIMLVPYDNGYLYRYNAETGEYISKSEITVSSGGKYKVNVYQSDDGNKLIVSINSVIDIIDASSYLELASVSNAVAYNAPTDTFIVDMIEDYSYPVLSYYRHYRIDELIEKAKEMTKGAELTDAQKAKYGLK